MSSTNPGPLDDEIFAHALTLPRDARAAYLAAACGADGARRAHLDSMLAAAAGAAAADFMALRPAPARPEAEAVGDRVGRYVLRQELGEGGYGRVFHAEQLEPVRRDVALKVIKLGMDTAAVIARFEAERQTLALMDHASIAKIFDAGSTDRGRPFFAMELVRGIRITDYCRQRALGRADILRLFITVCFAVQHAHQKGVIHRDLKPSNILIAPHDGRPVPKIIDFGIAKATQAALTDATQLTGVDQVIGTPAYMSPEQAEPGARDVDTRSDIYALGVVLYELLAGRRPFDDGPGTTSRTREPARPSTHVPALRGDLDWIVMKCLEADRARRYDSAASLARDLERHLADEPVMAAAPSTRYVLGKLFRRHRVAVVTGGVIAFLLVGGLSLSTWLYLRERAKLERARYAEQKAAEGWHAALQQQALSQQERARAADALEALAAVHAQRGEAAQADALRAEASALRQKNKSPP